MPPAMSVSGQVKFTKSADKISPNFEFHSLWIAGPKPGSSKPRIRFDGLTVGLKTGAVNVEATAIAVDGSLPDLYDPGVLPKDVTTEGFLASGKLDIQGWASMSGAMGFLEMRKEGNPTKHSFFIYGQDEKLAEPIDTPVRADGPAAYFTRLPIKAMLAAIRTASAPSAPGVISPLRPMESRKRTRAASEIPASSRVSHSPNGRDSLTRLIRNPTTPAITSPADAQITGTSRQLTTLSSPAVSSGKLMRAKG